MNGSRAGMWTWLLQRLTALYLAFGLVVHFYVHHFLFKPASQTSDAVNGGRFYSAEFISERLGGSWGWGIFYLLLLFCCAYHGFFGLLKIVEDHVTDKATVAWLNTIAWLLVTATMIAGVIVFRALTDTPVFIDGGVL